MVEHLVYIQKVLGSIPCLVSFLLKYQLTQKITRSYHSFVNILWTMGFSVQHSKTEWMGFTRRHNDPPPPLRLSDDITLHAPSSWRYLGFFFDRKLTFKEHVRHYQTKALSTVNCSTILGNSIR